MLEECSEDVDVTLGDAAAGADCCSLMRWSISARLDAVCSAMR